MKNWKWGAANMPFEYMFEPCYDDGMAKLNHSLTIHFALKSV